jgi:hypothetical protein
MLGRDLSWSLATEPRHLITYQRLKQITQRFRFRGLILRVANKDPSA